MMPDKNNEDSILKCSIVFTLSMHLVIAPRTRTVFDRFRPREHDVWHRLHSWRGDTTFFLPTYRYRSYRYDGTSIGMSSCRQRPVAPVTESPSTPAPLNTRATRTRRRTRCGRRPRRPHPVGHDSRNSRAYHCTREVARIGASTRAATGRDRHHTTRMHQPARRVLLLSLSSTYLQVMRRPTVLGREDGNGRAGGGRADGRGGVRCASTQR